jgi:serine/threonine protein kinase
MSIQNGQTRMNIPPELPSGKLLSGRYRIGPPLDADDISRYYAAKDERLHRSVTIRQSFLEYRNGRGKPAVGGSPKKRTAAIKDNGNGHMQTGDFPVKEEATPIRSSESQAKFLAKICPQLSPQWQPYVVDVLDYFEDKRANVAYMVLEPIHWKLSNYQKRLSHTKVREYVRDIGFALRGLHKKRYVQCLLASEAIWIVPSSGEHESVSDGPPDGKAVLVDFRQARRASANNMDGSTSMAGGTSGIEGYPFPDFDAASAESNPTDDLLAQIRHTVNPNQDGAFTEDIYELAVVYYNLLTGKTPTENGDPFELAEGERDPFELPSEPGGLSDRIKEALKGAFRKQTSNIGYFLGELDLISLDELPAVPEQMVKMQVRVRRYKPPKSPPSYKQVPTPQGAAKNSAFMSSATTPPGEEAMPAGNVKASIDTVPSVLSRQSKTKRKQFGSDGSQNLVCCVSFLVLCVAFLFLFVFSTARASEPSWLALLPGKVSQLQQNLKDVLGSITIANSSTTPSPTLAPTTATTATTAISTLTARTPTLTFTTVPTLIYATTAVAFPTSVPTTPTGYVTQTPISTVAVSTTPILLIIKPPPSVAFAHPAFEEMWNKTDFSDLPVDHNIARQLVWGNGPFKSCLEDFAEVPEIMKHKRRVQYFPKSRMEINDPNANKKSPYFITNGLLALEMIEGKRQIGKNSYAYFLPADMPVVGDGDVKAEAPTYAALNTLINVRAPNRVGHTVLKKITRSGATGNVSDNGERGLTIRYFDEERGHNIPEAFWNFLQATTPSLGEEGNEEGKKDDWTYVAGRPISEPYRTMARVKVGGDVREVMIQAFERRILLHVWDDPELAPVQSNDIGYHYYIWRYGSIDAECGQSLP